RYSLSRRAVIDDIFYNNELNPSADTIVCARTNATIYHVAVAKEFLNIIQAEKPMNVCYGEFVQLF
ncbi:unnamed protein product, partial [Rotaria sp. Silwood1]